MDDALEGSGKKIQRIVQVHGFFDPNGYWHPPTNYKVDTGWIEVTENGIRAAAQTEAQALILLRQMQKGRKNA